MRSRRTLQTLGITAASALLLAVVAAGCGLSESACGKAASANRPTHACYLENKREQAGLRDAENEVKEAEYGSLHAAHEAEHAEQIEGEVNEVEEVLKQREAERTANALEGR